MTNEDNTNTRHLTSQVITEPSNSLPTVAGEHYQTDSIVIDYHQAEYNVHHFISPLEIITFAVMEKPEHIYRAFNSDVLTYEMLFPETFGLTEFGAQVYARTESEKPVTRLLAISYDPQRRLELEEEASVKANRFDVSNNHQVTHEMKVLRELGINFVRNGFQGGKIVAESLTNLIIMETIQAINKKPLQKTKKTEKLNTLRLQRTLDFIEENLANDIGIKDLSEVAALSEYHFLRCFKNSTGHTPYAYLTSRRVERATSFLKKTELRIYDIAIACGFSSYHQMAAAFNRTLGITPTEYRKRSK